ncbi:MAG: DUF4294 domain-containing protein [Bacteroidia bacterium]
MRAVFYIKSFNLKYTLLFLSFFSLDLFSQTDYPYATKVPEGYRVTAMVINNDTVPCIWMPWVIISERMPFATRKKYAEWTRLKQNVKRVYPYAILAAAKLKEFDIACAKIPKESDRKAFLKKSEKELQKQFGEELKGLSINQGKILMKLIDRETGKTTYSIVKELRGNFTAFMWQSLASLYGSSMKQEYDLNNPDDKLIEVAVKQIEAGEF